MELLLEHGADPAAEAGEPFGGTPLEWCERGSTHADQAVFDGHRESDYVRTAAAIQRRISS